MALKKLFTPYQIGTVKIPNRLVVPAMVTNYCTIEGKITERYMKYIEEKAKGGWGLIITEDYAVQQYGKGYQRIPGLYKDELIEGNKQLTTMVHKYESKIFCQCIIQVDKLLELLMKIICQLLLQQLNVPYVKNNQEISQLLKSIN